MNVSSFLIGNLPWCWLFLTIVFIVVEVLTFSLTTVWFACGSFVLVFLSFAPIPFRWQLLIFAVISFTFLIFTRPFVVKKLRIKSVPMNSDGLIGKKILVNEKISELEKGSVKVNGVVWSARTSDGSALEAGCECVIEAIEGATLVVSRPK
ncbi:MAG: NfeD family protein [Treponema sp.]|nr:NfeD family protein [Treponema sp.]